MVSFFWFIRWRPIKESPVFFFFFDLRVVSRHPSLIHPCLSIFGGKQGSPRVFPRSFPPKIANPGFFATKPKKVFGAPTPENFFQIFSRAKKSASGISGQKTQPHFGVAGSAPVTADFDDPEMRARLDPLCHSAGGGPWRGPLRFAPTPFVAPQGAAPRQLANQTSKPE